MRKECAESKVIADAGRDPSVAAMEEAIKGLGRFVTVRKDGGDFKTIKEALDAVPPRSLIEIQDEGTYHEEVVFPKEKERITLRGKKGLWPVVASMSPSVKPAQLVTIRAAETTLERIIIAHRLFAAAKSEEAGTAAVAVFAENARIRSSLVYGNGCRPVDFGGSTEAEDSIFLAKMGEGLRSRNMCATPTRLAFRNCLVVPGIATGSWEMRNCTVPGDIELSYCGPTLFRDCVLGRVHVWPGEPRIEYCCLSLRMTVNFDTIPWRLGKGCLTVDPRFTDPEKLNYRLRSSSPCYKKASDGSDMGCRFTPEMQEMIQKALDLRKRRFIDF
jgi:hypothetical protein